MLRCDRSPVMLTWLHHSGNSHPPAGLVIVRARLSVFSFSEIASIVLNTPETATSGPSDSCKDRPPK
jgi:hypothetical protein